MKQLLALCVLAVVACGGKGKGGDGKPPPPAGDPVAVAVVMSGWEIWIGNETYVPKDDPSSYVGALSAVAKAFDDAKLNPPAGSVGTVITYADKAKVLVPMGPLADLKGSAFGTQKDYSGTTGSELVAGATLALDTLKSAPAKRKALIVLGDGNDTNLDTAKARLAKLRDEAKAAGVEVYAIVYKTQLSMAESPVKELAPDALIAGGADALGIGLAAVLHRFGGK